ncbi:cyclic GMP-AMP synthase-like [Sphaerodactylus townsendi]|uniref:cyclic GMP-AMP synthase-like n=1 Tax=Sphaerodactylus townsendi TaxID=933632 RepID=UPI00202616DD|nr:cyclic GMP-AMP synthase-like [Sphaerodactylus townsendi]
MERRAAGRGKSARKTIAAPPAPEEEAAKAAPAPRVQNPSCKRPVKAKASLSEGGSRSGQAGKETAPRPKTSLEKSTPNAQKRDLAGKSDGPSPEKEELHVEAKAAVEETAKSPPRGRKASQKKCDPKAKEPDQKKASEALPPRVPPPARRSFLREVVENLKLPKRKISEASQRVNWVRTRLVNAIRKKTCFSTVEILGTGSYYEQLKINKPDEFDIMLKVPSARLQLVPENDSDYNGAHYFVILKRNPKLKQLEEFVDGEYLSASKMLSEMRTIITDEVKTIKEMKVTMERKKPGSPAVTLQIEDPTSLISVDIILALEMEGTTLWDHKVNRQDIKNWLGIHEHNKLRMQRRCLVPKNAKVEAHFKDTWRLSFSLAEKTIIKYHGNTKTCCETRGKQCCRKDCLKLLKFLLEQLKTKHNQLNKFCSYHAKTAFFHTCTMWPTDEEWQPINLEECFERLLGYFIHCLKKAELKHFFIPECNLFGPDLKCSILVKIIESERTHGFPILKSA